MLLTDELVALWYAQNCLLNPLELFLVAVAITYCTLALLPAVVLPKCCAALTASAANCDWRGLRGAVVALSAQTLAKMLLGLPAAVSASLQNTVLLLTF